VIRICVLGPVTVRDEVGPVDVKGPRHRELLARLVAARGRVVPLPALIDDLWPVAPAGARSAVRTFVSALRAAMDPERRVIVTEGPGYALRAGSSGGADGAVVDAWEFERLAADGSWDAALALWRGPAYADFPDAEWARADRGRLTERRLAVAERLAEARLAAGRPESALPDLDAHVTEHPWREEGWRLLALALYRAHRTGDALAVLRRARARLADELGLDPGPRLAELETAILHRDPALDPERAPLDDRRADAAPPASDPAASGRAVGGAAVGGAGAAGRLFAQAAASWSGGEAATLESTVGLLRGMALGGAGPVRAARQRVEVVAAAEELGDPELTARVIGAYDVPGSWARSDDPAGAAAIVAAAERTLRALPPGRDEARARVLATIALESRGLPDPRGRDAASAADRLARRVGDPALRAFALAARWMQTFHRAGLAAERDALGRELLDLTEPRSPRTSEPGTEPSGVPAHLASFAILGHLVRMQSLSALGDLDAAAAHARAAERLGQRHDRPATGVLVRWFEALRAATEDDPAAESHYREAAAALAGRGMPGVEHGLLDLALTGLRVWRGKPVAAPTDPGPYAPWIHPHVLLAAGRTAEAAALLRTLPDPPPDHLQEALWVLAGRAALAVDDPAAVDRATRALAPAAGEIAGAGSGMLTVGPVVDHLRALGHRPTG